MKKKLIALFSILFAAFLIRSLVLQSYESTTDYMADTLAVGDYFLVNKFVFGRNIPFTDLRLLSIRDPNRGDVVVFSYPEDPAKDFVMRVVGVAGDEVEGRDKRIYVNGSLSDTTHVSHRENDIVQREQNPRDNFGPIRVPANSLFVMGDNRDRSYDSRFWGCLPCGKLKGLAFFKYWSWDQEQRHVRWGRVGTRID